MCFTAHIQDKVLKGICLWNIPASLLLQTSLEGDIDCDLEVPWERSALDVFFFKYLYFCLYWVFVALHGLSLVVGCGLLLCGGRAWALQHQAPVVVAHGLSSYGSQTQQLWCTSPAAPAACGIFPDQEWNRCPLHGKVDSTTEPPGKPCPQFLCHRSILKFQTCSYWFKNSVASLPEILLLCPPNLQCVCLFTNNQATSGYIFLDCLTPKIHRDIILSA